MEKIMKLVFNSTKPNPVYHLMSKATLSPVQCQFFKTLDLLNAQIAIADQFTAWSQTVQM